jgi:DNA-binding HxlR family transcriptional regulator
MDTEHIQLTGRIADRDSWVATRCSIDRTFALVGTRSAMLLMREAYYGGTRFDDFVSRTGMTEAVTAARLKELVEIGLLERRPYQEPGSRTRHEYVLTEAGRDLLPALLGMLQWGDKYLAPRDGGPGIVLRHADCGAAVAAEVRCAAGHAVAIGEIEAHSTRARPRASSRVGAPKASIAST